MIKVVTISPEYTIVKKDNISVELTKHDDYFMGKNKPFWRVDCNGKTISSLLYNKSDAIKDAKKYIKKETFK